MAPTREKQRRASTLGFKKVPPSVQVLEKRLQEADEHIRRQAIRDIPTLGAPKEPLTDSIVCLLRDNQDWYVKKSASSAMSRSALAGASVLAAETTGPCLENEDHMARRCAGDALVGLVGEAAKLHEEPDDTAFHSSRDVELELTDDVKASIPEGADAAASEAAERLVHTDPRVRQNAVNALSRMGENAAVHAAALGKVVNDPDLAVRNELIRAFARLGKFAANGAIAAGEGLAHRDEAVRRSATRVLVALSPFAGVEAADGAAAHLHSEDAVIRSAAAACLKELGTPVGPHCDVLANLLEDKDVNVRHNSALALISAARFATPSMKKIMKRMHDPNLDTRRAAVLAMRGLSLACSKFTRAVGKILEEDPEPLPRIRAIEVLGGSGRHVKPFLLDLVNSLEDKDWAVRRAAIDAFEDLGADAAKASGEIARRLLHPEADARRAAAEALGRMGLHCGEYGHRVEAALDTEADEDVRRTCAQAVQMLHAAGMPRE